MNIRSLFAFLLVVSLVSCGGHVPAPVVHHGTQSGAGSAGVHNVVSGDTLYSISNRYALPMRDIVELNRLQAPFRLHQGRRLRLPPPREYQVQMGDTLYGVSRMFEVNSSDVARLNKIQTPYVLRVGQVLRMPSVVRVSRVASKNTSTKGASTSDTARVGSVSRDELLSNQKAVSQERKTIVENGVPQPGTKPVKSGASKVSNSGPVKVAKVKRAAPPRASSKFMRPVGGKIISSFGVKKSGLHNDGINIQAPRGAAVKAAENGVVVYTGNALKGAGNLILLRHADQWVTAYAHLDTIAVKQGQEVKRGSRIGSVGSTGTVSTPQLHFEVRRGTSALNPTKYME